MRWNSPAIGLAIALLALMPACSSSPTAPRGGTLAVHLTDDPADELSELNVYITGLTVKPDDGPVERIANDIGLVDLLELQDATLLLVTAGLEPGSYDHIRVELDQDRSNVVEKDGGATKPLQIASQEVKVNGGFVIESGEQTELTLDFDAGASLRRQGNGGWLLVPVIIQMNAPGQN